MKKLFFVLFMVLFFSGSNVQAQNISDFVVRVYTVDSSDPQMAQNPLAGASVAILSYPSKSPVAGSVTNTDGRAFFTGIPRRGYVNVSYLGYQDQEREYNYQSGDHYSLHFRMEEIDGMLNLFKPLYNEKSNRGDIPYSDL